MIEANEVDGEKCFKKQKYFAINYLHEAKAVHNKVMQKIQHFGTYT